jgi:hypothetical protein
VPDRKSPSDDELKQAFGDVGDALKQALVLSTDRIQAVFEDAVVRGRMTRRDAEELAASLVQAGREQAADIRDDAAELARTPAKVASSVVAKTPAGKRRKRKQEAASERAATSDATALSSLTASAAIDLVNAAGLDELASLRAGEQAGKARVTVLRAIDRRLAG